MKRRNLLFAAAFAMATLAGLSVKAQDSVFSYAYQGTTLYYIIDSNQLACVVSPDYPDLHYNADSTDCDPWYGHAQPQGAVVVPDSVMFNGAYFPVTALRSRAFYKCISLQSITLPQCMTDIGLSALRQCTGLQSVTFAGSLTPGARSRIKVIGRQAFRGCTSLQSITLPDSVTTIKYAAFYHCTGLQSVTFPEALTTIEDYAFGECDALQSAILPNYLTTIGKYGFVRCPGLQSVAFPQNLTTIGEFAFCDCPSLQSISLPEGLTTIGKAVFRSCSGLQSVTLPQSLTTMGSYAFSLCSSLQSIDIPGSVNNIDEWTFTECNALVSVTLHEGIDTIGFCAFRECYNLTTINYPTSLKVIGDFAFQYDTSLAIPLILPEGLTYLGIVAYGDCRSLVTATIPGSLGEIASEVFWGCTSLATVTIEDGITAIGEGAFHDCFIDTLFVKCTVPPDLGTSTDSVFLNFNTTVVVPCSTAVFYQNYEIWRLFSEIIEDCEVGIPEVVLPNVTIRVVNSRIEVEGVDGENIRVFDITGRVVRNESLSAGVYLVQIGNRPAQNVVVHPNM